MGTGRRRGPGWRIVRSIVRLLYLVPSSFCGSLSHPFSLPAFPATRQPRVLRPPRSSCSGLTFVCRAHRLLTPTPIPVFTLLLNPPSLSLTYLTSPPRPCSPFPLVLASSSLARARARVASPFLGLFPLSATTTISIGYHYYLNTVTSSSSSLRRSSLREHESQRREEGKEREEKRDLYTRIRARVAAVIYMRGPQIRPTDRSGFVGGASDN